MLIVLLTASATFALPYLHAPTTVPQEWKCSPYLNVNKTFIAKQTTIFTGLACPKNAQVVIYECSQNCLEKTLAAKGPKIEGRLAEFRNYTIDHRYYYDCITCKDPATNQDPVITTPNRIMSIQEGKTVTLSATCTDPERDRVFLSYSGWMNTPSRLTTYDDEGTHSVNVECLDEFGLLSKQTITINVINRNRPPVIETIFT